MMGTLAACAFTAACSDDTATSGDAGSGAATTSGSGGGAATTGTGGTTMTGTGGGSDDIPGGGTVLFEEPFEDTDFMARGWYDGPAGTITNTETATGSGSSFECLFQSGATSCAAGKPARHKLTDSDTVYMGFWLKLSANWIGSGLPYHPHMFHFLTNLDSDYVGPANSFLTTYQEIVDGRAMLALQDSQNVDDNCILRNDDTFVGCNGDFASYVFGENRSVAACNGLLGFVDGRDCFDNGGYWYSARAWYSADGVWADAGWHFVEIYFAINSIANGVGVADGKIRWVQDGQTLISSDQILFRTGQNPTMQFNQFAMLPYIGAGSPIAQSFWMDELVVATARP
jgi:hypothetical protein